MIGTRVRITFTASAWNIAAAILIRAEEGSTALHTLGYARFTGIETVLRTLRIHGYFSACRE